MRIAIQLDVNDRDAGCDYPDFCRKCWNNGDAKRRAEAIVKAHPDMVIDHDMDPDDHPDYADEFFDYDCECCGVKLTNRD